MYFNVKHVAHHILKCTSSITDMLILSIIIICIDRLIFKSSEACKQITVFLTFQSLINGNAMCSFIVNAMQSNSLIKLLCFCVRANSPKPCD